MRNRLSENRRFLEPEIKQMGQEAVNVLLQQIYNTSQIRPCGDILFLVDISEKRVTCRYRMDIIQI